MIPAAFDYVRADSADAAIAALVEHGDDAKLLAGGHSLLPLMKLRLAAPSVLVDIGRLSDLSYVRDGGDHVAIGGLTRHRDLETSDLLGTEAPAAAPRRRAGRRPAGAPPRHHRRLDRPRRPRLRPARPCCWPCGRRSSRKGPDGERTIPVDDFFTGFLETALSPTELLTEIRVPKAAGAGWSFQKLNRRAQDWAIVGVAAVQNGTTGIGLVNMGSVPLRAAAAEAAASGGASAADAAAVADEGTEPSADLNASAEFRRHLAQVLVRRALEECGDQARLTPIRR